MGTARGGAQATDPWEFGRAGVGFHNGSTIREEIHQTIAVIVHAVAHLGATVGHTEISITEVTSAVLIGIHLISITDLGAIVTGIAEAVLVFIQLVGVGHIGAIVFDAQSVIIRVQTDAFGAFQGQ